MVWATSSCATAAGLPVLADSSRARRSAFSATRSATRCSSSERSFGVSLAHCGAAATAAATATSVSSAVPSATWAIVRSLLGSTTSIDAPELPGWKDPATKCCPGGSSDSGTRPADAWARRTVGFPVMVGMDM